MNAKAMVPLQATGDGRVTVGVSVFPHASTTVGGLGCATSAGQFTELDTSAGSTKSASWVQVAVRDTVVVLPHESTAVNVLVWEREHPLLWTGAVDMFNVGVLQESKADAEPNAALMAAESGLHPRFKLLPVAVTIGGVTSCIQVAVRDVLAVFPQESAAVNVRV
jgi:hypothetical protein